MKLLRLAACTVTALLALSTALRAQEPRLSNISTRGANKQVLIRAIGPTLSAFGLTGVLADPVLTVFNSSNVAVATNDNWATPVGTGAASAATLTSTFTSVGAFALNAASKDSAVIATLPPGNYTAQVAGLNNTTGLALVEVYEIGGTGAKLLNTSTRLQISAASAPIIGMVVAPGTGTRKLLIRTAGPALAAFGLTGTLDDPSLKITDSKGVVLATNDNWGTRRPSPPATNPAPTPASSPSPAPAKPSSPSPSTTASAAPRSTASTTRPSSAPSPFPPAPPA
ncbi:MAG: hypothetical protein NTV51_22610 [Verrucomicrobia bacterium]|nr:hypothetical protein [Verrucomicrobiota bacterium]